MDAHVHLGLCTDFTRMVTGEQSPAELVFDGNPLDDPKIFVNEDRVALVIQNGKVVKNRPRG